jgi:hypothetical protein
MKPDKEKSQRKGREGRGAQETIVKEEIKEEEKSKQEL